MFCQNCSAVDTDGAKFCRDCGESLSEGSRLHPFWVWRNWRCLGKVNSFKVPLDTFLFHLFPLKRTGPVYLLSGLTVGSIAFASIVIGFHFSRWFGLFTLLVGAPLIFLFMVAFSRFILDFFAVSPRIADQREKPGGPSESRDEIEWNIQ